MIHINCGENAREEDGRRMHVFLSVFVGTRGCVICRSQNSKNQAEITAVDK